MKKAIVCSVVLLLSTTVLFTTALFAQTAAEIVHSSRNRIKSTTTSVRARMVITAKNGSTTERVVDEYSKDGPNGTRMIIQFQSPASVRGTRFLTMEAKNGATDQWIFLPSLGKVRRIAASEGSGSFMGTDMSYDDISSASRDTDLDTHTLLREETLDGKICYVIESKPKDSSYQYSRTVSWIDKDTLVNYRIDLYDKRNTLVKRMEMSDVRDIQGRLTPMQTKMSTITAGTSTTIYNDIMKYDDTIPERVFTTTYLETGR
ncbi:sigma E regulatory protein, MucB/RseB [Spirochaetia bacterium]|nr:sigma E regulatory protein, MucB/RseB [Spirochaetia bacterium]